MKQFLIVGGSSGIGFALAQKLIADESKPLVIARNPGELNLQQVDFYEADVLNQPLPELHQPLQGLVYCPGSITLKPIRSLKEQDFLNDFHINVLGAVRIIQKYLSNLKEGTPSSIILFSSVAVESGMNFHSSIAAAKGAVEGLMRTLAAELAPSIRVNAIALSLTQTRLAARLTDTESKLQAAKERHPLKQVGNAADVASLVHWLLSEASKCVSGQVIKMDGGLSSLR